MSETKSIKWTSPIARNPVAYRHESLVASGGKVINENIPVEPPIEWFKEQEFSSAQPVQVTDDGRIFGHVAKWGSVHIGYLDMKVPVPRSEVDYAYFMNKRTKVREGSKIATGVVVMDTVHPKLHLGANETSLFYDDTGFAFADVRVYEDAFGIQIAGALRPNVTKEQMRVIDGSDYSPDWRGFSGGSLEMVGLIACNLSGFLVEGDRAALVASGGITGYTGSLPGELDVIVENDAVVGLYGKATLVVTDEETLSVGEAQEELPHIEEVLSTEESLSVEKDEPVATTEATDILSVFNTISELEDRIQSLENSIRFKEELKGIEI